MFWPRWLRHPNCDVIAMWCHSYIHSFILYVCHSSVPLFRTQVLFGACTILLSSHNWPTVKHACLRAASSSRPMQYVVHLLKLISSARLCGHFLDWRHGPDVYRLPFHSLTLSSVYEAPLSYYRQVLRMRPSAAVVTFNNWLADQSAQCFLADSLYPYFAAQYYSTDICFAGHAFFFVPCLITLTAVATPRYPRALSVSSFAFWTLFIIGPAIKHVEFYLKTNWKCHQN